MDQISLGQIARDLNFRSLTPDIDVENVMISHSDINRPSLQLTGFFEHFDNHRIQIMGNVEMAYLRTLTQEKRYEVFEELFKILLILLPLELPACGHHINQLYQLVHQVFLAELYLHQKVIGPERL